MHGLFNLLSASKEVSGPNTFTENETIAKYEIMDGAPVRGESIPIRVFLAGYDLTPTMRDINKKFSVKYFLNLVLMDEEDRRYFKQQEITLWRKGEKAHKGAGGHTPSPHVPSHLVSAEGGPQGSESMIRDPPPDSAPKAPVEDMTREDGTSPKEE
ncbi:hypothetical protein LSTR_LSTR014268 [Laodelphax striatellus]|uniref:Vacuolar protein sorting-associated protein 26 n=1 Tax=Laodelphax striatellus TaxID=195883 RepID=A0A482XLU7_LAOST|nr:hypothetical protein LSTR_LSTR014268 [Laodelphax striatellus]